MNVGQHVCRKADRYKTVGTVVAVEGDRVSVRWDTTRQGLVRLDTGRGLTTELDAASLVLADEFNRRPHSPPPADAVWTMTTILVSVVPPPPTCEYGINAWQFRDENEALDKLHELAEAGIRAKASKREETEYLPAGCRKLRKKSRWIEIGGVG